MRTDSTAFVVFDTETTGVDARTDRVIEIGAVRLDGLTEVGRFSTLVNPERIVPRRITEITGLSTASVIGAPLAAEAIPAFLAFAEGAVLVGHNVAFDVGMVNAELARLGHPPLDHPTLDTLRLARRLLHGHRSKGLSAVTEHFGIRVHGRHRALGDAEATAEVLRRFVAMIGPRARTLDGLVGYQNTRYAEGAAAGHLAALRETIAAQPDRPGVYFFRDRKGAVVYVGKAKRLRTRLRSYVTAVEAKSGRLRQMMDEVRTVETTETGSELAALLLESGLIKEMQPRFNRASLRYRTRPFVRLGPGPVPTVSISSFTVDDGAEYFGPLAGRRQAEAVMAVIDRGFRLRRCDDLLFSRGTPCLYHDLDRCSGPCAFDRSAHDAEVERLRAFLLGRDTSVQADLRKVMLEAAAQRNYEAAATLRDHLAALERMADRQRLFAAPVHEVHAFVVEDAVEPDVVQVFAIRHGRHADTLRLARSPDPAVAAEADARLAAFVERHRAPLDAPTVRYFKREIDEVRLLAHWLYVHRASARIVHVAPADATADVLARLRAALHAPDDGLDADDPLDEADGDDTPEEAPAPGVVAQT